MTGKADSAAKRRSDPLRPLRYLYRAPLLLVLALIAIPLALFVFGPLARGMTSAAANRSRTGCSGGGRAALVRCFGFRIRRVGEPLPGAVMFVANHVSWLDIELMHSQRVMAFVAKEEISRWPLRRLAGDARRARFITAAAARIRSARCRNSMVRSPAQRHGRRHFSGRRNGSRRSRCARFTRGFSRRGR